MVHPRWCVQALNAISGDAVIEIREARASDVPDILRLNIELHEYSAKGVPSRLRIPERYDDEARHRYVDSVLTAADATYLLAVDRDDAIGYTEIHLQEPEEDPGVVPTRRAHLQALMVTGLRRREGVGRALLVASEDWARERGAEEMELDHWIFDGDPSVFYEHAGYVPLSEMRIKRLG
jgi:GNAT superfamily N-acetyltransferase